MNYELRINFQFSILEFSNIINLYSFGLFVNSD